MKQADENYIIYLNDDINVDFKEWERGDYQLHYHDYFEMEIVTSGSGSQILNGEEFKLTKGDVFLMRPLDFHKIHSDGIGFASINVNPSCLPKWIITELHSIKRQVVHHLPDKDFDTFINLTRMLYNDFNDKNDDAFLIKSTTATLLFSLFLRQIKNKILDNDVVSKIIYYLQKDYRFTKKISLDEIANYVGYSKYYTSSIFHKKYGIAIQDFIINLRIEYAKKLILETNYSITEISMESGFSSMSNFYSIFQKMVGCTPLKFKKRNSQ